MATLPANQNVAQSALDAHNDGTQYGQKGDIAIWNPVTLRWDRLPVGADTKVLTADSSQPLGIKWN